MTAEMETKIEGIDPHSTTSSLFLPSVKQVPRGDGLCLPKEWINGRLRVSAGGFSGCTLDPAKWCSPLGRMEVMDAVLTRFLGKTRCQCLAWTGAQTERN